MKKKNIINFSITAGLFTLFAIFTILVKFVDTSLVVATNTKIGFSSINKPIFEALGTSDVWNTISLILFIFAGIVVFTLAIIGIKEWLTHKQLSKVNHKILFLLGLYTLTAIFYFLFEILTVNYRPLLDEGLVKLSYPSSHTLLICVICLSACLIVPDYIKNKPLKITITCILIAISILAPLSRLLAGMHWFTDVVGSLILSVALVMCYYSSTCLIKKQDKQINEKTPE